MINANHTNEFFTQEHISFYSNIIKEKKPYNNITDNEKDRVKELFTKNNYWAKQVAGDNLEVIEDNRWQNSGHIKHYSWARIFDKNDKDRLIYFTLGFDVHGRLVYKLDCQRGQKMANHLSPEQVLKFDFLLKDTGANWNEILFDSLPNYNWESLISITRTFIDNHISLYREAIDYVWGEESLPKEKKFEFSAMPNIPNTFKERKPYFLTENIPSEINFEKQNRTSKKIGDLGEDFILKIEKQQMLDWGITDLVPEKMKDGVGYDIKSYNQDRSEKNIEVKTTVGGKSNSLIISQNEVEFLKSTSSACIYRVYNFKPKEGQGQIFMMTYSDLEKLNMIPKAYTVHFN